MALLDLVKHSNLNVRVKAVCALANVCDRIAQNPTILSQHPTSTPFFCSIFSQLLERAHESDKVRSNALRGLGHLARIASLMFLLQKRSNQGSSTALLEQFITTLISNIKFGVMKVQLCHLFQNILVCF